MKQLWDIIRIIEKALQHNDEGVKAYARRLATKYRQEGDDSFADSYGRYILTAVTVGWMTSAPVPLKWLSTCWKNRKKTLRRILSCLHVC